MVHRLPDLAVAIPTPALRVAPPSLTVAVPTAMLLVDYALAGNATPTAEPTVIAESMPADLVEASHPIRAAFAHGSALRTVLLAQLPGDHPGHSAWPALREWLAGLSDDRILGLIEYGVRSVLAYGKPRGRDRDDPPEAVGAMRGASAELLRDAILALESWGGIADPDVRAEELLDPVGVRTTLLALLDLIWEQWLAAAWQEQLPKLRAAVGSAPEPPPGCGGAQWISLVTGLRPDPQYAEVADRAASLTLMPCPGLGRSLSIAHITDQDDTLVLYSLAAPGERTARVDRAGLSVGALAALAPTMHALGDRTRLAIVLQLLEHGPLSMQQLADTLRIHQSTVSRQVGTLRKAGLAKVVNADGDRRIAPNPETVRKACRTLLDALD